MTWMFKKYYILNVFVPLKVLYHDPTPQCHGNERWGLWKMFRLWGWGPHWVGLVALWKETLELALLLGATWGYGEKRMVIRGSGGKYLSDSPSWTASCERGLLFKPTKVIVLLQNIKWRECFIHNASSDWHASGHLGSGRVYSVLHSAGPDASVVNCSGKSLNGVYPRHVWSFRH